MVQLLIEQILNGVQYGVFLFLVSAGLTLVFGIMGFINLAHGVLYMVGAYSASVVYLWSGSFLLALVVAPAVTAAIGLGLERLFLRYVYARDHLDQVTLTFGILVFINQFVVSLFGGAAQPLDIPEFLSGYIELTPDLPYPVYRLAIIAVGVLMALFMYWMVTRTRVGALIRAGASDRVMLSMLGVNVNVVYCGVFCLGTALAALSGVIAAPLVSVGPGMGDDILVMAFVVIVIGGIGSVKGALIASLLVGVIEVLGRTTLKTVFAHFLSADLVQTLVPATASMSVYILMIAVLYFRPQGLFASGSR